MVASSSYFSTEYHNSRQKWNVVSDFFHLRHGRRGAGPGKPDLNAGIRAGWNDDISYIFLVFWDGEFLSLLVVQQGYSLVL
jgi:hypothetical protein